ncbi:glycosyltransferase family A protein [Helicobacter sp.]|uniref:glycosyltransferase family A protein n=1 Tax=Helicobacter sp. TaxID=218 RepID=UPI00199E4982|nr:glycosyltransferase family A protein [Helicobacter sp.]MBD5165901.1 glycosyltransferase family 2 protein [Helicobacter sp.]
MPPPPQLFAKGYAQIQLTYITHFYCNQKNIDSVISLLRLYESYSPELLDLIMFVVVDDGSPLHYEIPHFNLNLRWIKIKEDIPWNQAGARNLGVTYAVSDKIVLSDLDFYLFENTLWHLVRHKPCGRNVYKIYRENEKGECIRGHVNMFFMSRARFMRFFGYDEEFAGHYGREDDSFKKLHKWSGSKLKYLPKKFRSKEWIESTNTMDSSSYHNLIRTRESPNYSLHERKKQEVYDYGAEYGYSRLFLHNFTWEFLSEQRRVSYPKPKPNRWWFYLWYWRWLVGYA